MIDPLLRDDPDLNEHGCPHCDYYGELAGYHAHVGPQPHVEVYGVICSDCLDAIEREDAPEELAITLGDKLSPLEEAEIFAREPLSARLDSAFKPYKGFMGR